MSLDPLSALGIQLRREVPVGEAFVDWLLDDDGLREMADALLDYSDDPSAHEPVYPFGWREITTTIHDLSRGRWSPSMDYVIGLYWLQGGQKIDRQTAEAGV